jgi:hypothetical protein
MNEAALSRRRWLGLSEVQIDCFRPFALFVGFDIEGDPLTFVQSVETRLLNGRYMDENIATAIVGFDEAVSLVGVEKFDGSLLRHDATSLSTAFFFLLGSQLSRARSGKSALSTGCPVIYRKRRVAAGGRMKGHFA